MKKNKLEPRTMEEIEKLLQDNEMTELQTKERIEQYNLETSLEICEEYFEKNEATINQLKSKNKNSFEKMKEIANQIEDIRKNNNGGLTYNIGAVVGENDELGKIQNIVVGGQVEATSSHSNHIYVGGIAGIADGEIENSIIFRSVVIKKGSVIKDSIILQQTEIGENVTLENVIVDKKVIVRDNKRLIGTEDFPVVVGKGKVI